MDDCLLTDVRLDGGALSAGFSVPAAHAILRGHFPGAPLVPGVLLLDAVRGACERARGTAYTIAEVVEVRFARPLAPDTRAELQAELADDAGALLVAGDWRLAAGRIAAFRLRLVARACGG